MTFKFRVEKVADLRHPAFFPDPNDAGNTIDSGKWTQEVTLERLPDPMRGGLGSLVLQLNNEDEIGAFQPGQTVTVKVLFRVALFEELPAGPK